MSIDYFELSEKYRPKKIETLLVAEGPPPSGKRYFYLPTKMNSDRDIRNYRSLPATIFYHYFKAIPNSIEDYELLLLRLKERNIFLIDILDAPLKIRDRSFPNGVNKKNYDILISKIPKLKDKIHDRGISVPEDRIIFLLARTIYKKELVKEFPNSKFFRWIDFRLSYAK
ncbi:MAG TPA: hypothetical protein PKI84_06810 [Methanofastidiosum sp.]|jgi:hypothetical protein|nr:hypothetical protein [Methanofastidiosum sp.]HPX25059.1 hypothetical protein [Methanofastidiosum sp.]HQC24906.1 hypothetical protein [Methanofastidiosum sp.]